MHLGGKVVVFVASGTCCSQAWVVSVGLVNVEFFISGADVEGNVPWNVCTPELGADLAAAETGEIRMSNGHVFRVEVGIIDLALKPAANHEREVIMTV